MAEIVVALDVETRESSIALVDRLPDLAWVKIGPILFVRSGPSLIELLKERGLRVFLDLKWYDIPNTVAEAARVAADSGVDLATVHALGGSQMIEAAREAAGGMRLAAVTVLTSFESDDYWETLGGIGGGPISGEVVRLARMAVDAGAGAVVSSVEEISVVRHAVGSDPWIVVPGIRSYRLAADDQHRVGTPEEAVAAGATHLVVGRPIYRASDPTVVYQEMCQAIR
jgi:orotidine-5'-phosphate decarboxylase